MFYSISFISFFLLILSLVSIYSLYWKISINHYSFLAAKKVLSFSDCNAERFFSSFILRKIVSVLGKKKNKKCLLQFISGQYKPVYKFLDKSKNFDLSFTLLAHFEPKKALEKLEKQIRQDPKNELILSALAELYLLTHNFSKTILVLEKISEKNTFFYAKKLYMEALLALKDADMLSASQKALKAAKIFNKNKAYYEEAKCYILLGTIYRASGIFDPAQFIFSTALEIYEEISYSYGVVEALGNLGMLMSLQKRYAEATDFFDKAIQKNTFEAYEAHILNQKALNCILNKKLSESENFLNQALLISEKFSDNPSKAFGLELLSYIYQEQKHFKQAIKYSEKSGKIHQELDNISAFLESLYVQAFSSYELEDYERAEKITREILEISEKELTNFHSANAYNLLGLIFIKKSDYQRAKVLFQKSLSLEQKNEREKGIATDYFNIALTDFLIGHKKQALESLNKALEYAKASEDEELVLLISNKINKINQTK